MVMISDLKDMLEGFGLFPTPVRTLAARPRWIDRESFATLGEIRFGFHDVG